MKIAHVASTFFPHVGGAEVAAHMLAYHQAKAGHEVVLYCRRQEWNECFKSSMHTSVPYSLRPLPKLPLKVALYQPRIATAIAHSFVRRQMREHHFDIWHATMMWPAGLFVSAASESVRVLTCQGVDIQTDSEIAYGQRLNSRFDKFARVLSTQFDLTTAVSGSVERDLKELGFEPTQIELLPNGVDVSRFQSMDRSEARRGLKLKEDDLIILTVGRNHPKKGFHLIPEIATVLQSMGISFRWVIVGRGTKRLESEIIGRGLESSVSLVEEVPPDSMNHDFVVPAKNLVAYYRAADVFCLPAILEGLAIVLVEAFASKLPVVTTNAPGCADVVSNERTGIVCQVNDIDSVAEAIRRLASDSALRRRMGSEGLREAQIRYDWQVITESCIKLYESRLEGQ